jgi:hypothetical protein
MAQEQGAFDFGDVVEAITKKLIRRHPHVFADEDGKTAEAVKGLWERIKAEERAERGEDKPAGALAGVPVALPALTRALKLQNKAGAVGFDWNDPRAVLAKIREEADEIEADVILHVRDMSHEDSTAQSQDVEKVLGELGIAPEDPRIVEVWNKIDRLDADARASLANMAERQMGERRPVLLSAITGEGTDALVAAIEARLSAARQTLSLSLDPADGAGLSWLYRHSEVLSRDMREDGRLALTVRADAKNAEIVRRKYAVA